MQSGWIFGGNMVSDSAPTGIQIQFVPDSKHILSGL